MVDVAVNIVVRVNFIDTVDAIEAFDVTNIEVSNFISQRVTVAEVLAAIDSDLVLDDKAMNFEQF